MNAIGDFAYNTGEGWQDLSNPEMDQCINQEFTEAINHTNAKALLYSGFGCTEPPFHAMVPGESWIDPVKTASAVRFEFA